jgi:hypothetical protein
MNVVALNPKFQNPNPKQIPSFKFQRSPDFGNEGLGFGIWGLFGIWDLGFGAFPP